MSFRSGLNVVVAIVILLGWSQCGRARGAEVTVEQIMEAWADRQKRIPAATFEWKEHRIYTQGAIMPPDFPGIEEIGEKAAKTGVPMKDMEYDFPGSFAIKGLWVRYTSSNMRVLPGGEVIPQDYVSSYDGESSRMRFISDHGKRGTIHKEERNTDSGSATLQPLMTFLRAFDPNCTLFKRSEFSIKQRDADVGGVHWIMLQDPSHRVWVDPARAFVILRSQYNVPNGQIAYQYDLTYQPDDHVGWVPKTWKVLQMKRDGSGEFVMSQEVEVTGYEINPVLKKADFQLEFSEGTAVYDETSGKKYRLGPDDQELPTKPRKGAGEKGAAHRWQLLIVVNAVLFLVIVAAVVRSKRKRIR